MAEKVCPKDQDGDRSQLKSHSKLQVPKQRGMILEPEQDNLDPSAVRSFTPEVEVEVGAGKTKTEAPESTRNHRKESLS